MSAKYTIFLFLFLSGTFKSFSQTILAPDLQCVQNNNTNGDITLYWTNPPANPCGAFVEYTIYASSTSATGPYDSVIHITSQSATSVVLTGYLSSPVWYFYMEAAYNCFGATVLQSDTVDNRTPIVPQIVNVTVTPGNDAIFNWEPSPSPQTAFYILYYYLNGNAWTMDTVYGRFTTTYTDVVAHPDSGSLSYTIAAVDSCGGISMFNILPHNTIFLTASITACEKEVNLSWNKYINFPQGVKEYQIYASVNSGAYFYHGSVDSNTTSYPFTNFQDGDTVCLYVRAVSAADTNVISNSNIRGLRASVIQPPDFIFLTNATVDASNQISITWTVDTLAELIFYKIARSGNNVTYGPIAQLNTFPPLLQYQTYVDSDEVFADRNPYYYEVTAFDSCQNQYVTPYVKTICLKGELYDYYVANLTWNDFELHGATVTRYNLYRNFGNGFQLIRTFPFGVNSYSDSLQQFLNEKGIFCYRIEAIYDLDLPEANNIYLANDTSHSNELCIIHRPIIYIPNAFRPSSPIPENRVFKPTMFFNTEPKGYTFQIYNRWGGLVFESNNSAVGWDGTDHGKEAQQGGYAYFLQFYAEDGVKVERQGMVLLIR